MEFLKKYSFRWKLFVGMLLAAFLALLTGYILMLQVFHMTYQNNLKQEAKLTIAAAGEALDAAFGQLYEAMNTLSESETIIEYLKENPDTIDFKVYRKLYEMTSMYGEYANFTIYDREGQKRCSVADNRYIKDKLSLDWGGLFDASRHPSQCIVQNARIYDGEERIEYLRISKAITDENGEILGYVISTLVKENFENIIRGVGKSERGILYAIDDFNETVFYSASTYDKAELRLARLGLKEAGDSYVSTDGGYFYYYDSFETCQLSVYYQQPVASLNQMKNTITLIAIVCAGVSFLICFGLSIYISNVFFHPIKRMKNAVTEFRKGNFDTTIQVQSEDELGLVSEGFNEVSKHLSENMKILLQREHELSTTNVKMMQAQLNPHFLYNTLDTLKWIGKENGIPEIATISMGLAEILRTSISSPSIIVLQEEISLVKAYVEIQQIRFEDKFEFIVEAPDELMTCKVPKLILQPLVENSILHGFTESEYGRIVIRVSKEAGNVLQIIVMDDGIGMTPEQVQKLNSSITLKKQTQEIQQTDMLPVKHESIGFYNVNAIIQLNYGTNYGAAAESEAGKGTKITIRLPLINNENG